MDNHDFQPDSGVPRGDTGTSRTARVGRVGARYSVTHGDHGATAIRLLNRALAIAQAVARRCECQYLAALRSHAPALAAAALAHANDAQIHTRRISARIGELGGETHVADLTPDATVAPKPAEARLAHSLPALLCNHLMAERIALESYAEIAAFFAPFDPTTRSLIEEIAAAGEQRKHEISGLLAAISNS